MAIKLIRFARVTEDLHDTIPSFMASFPTPFLVEYLKYPWFSMAEKGEMLNFQQALQGFQSWREQRGCAWFHTEEMLLPPAWIHPGGL